MKKFFTYVLKNSEFIHSAYNLFFQVKNKHLFFEEIEKRQNLSVFDYKELAQPIPFYPIEKLKDSNYYGHALALKKYAEIDKIESALEHGIYLGNRITVAEGYKTTKSVIAMSGNRVEAFKQHNMKKPIVAIGPYIHYAEPLLPDGVFADLKSKLGKVLLVMPVHAGTKVKISYNKKVFFDYINDIRKDFDTVLVCMYFREILNEPQLALDYEKLGFKIVCAGHWYDFNFIRRLKSIIMLSDYVISNSHGTNTGYCTFLGKPQTIVVDKSLTKNLDLYSDEVRRIRDLQVEEIENSFSLYSKLITDEQKRVVDKYWGTSLIKTPEELKNILESLNKF